MERNNLIDTHYITDLKNEIDKDIEELKCKFDLIYKNLITSKITLQDEKEHIDELKEDMNRKEKIFIGYILFLVFLNLVIFLLK